MFIAVNVIWIERMTLNKIGVFMCLDFKISGGDKKKLIETISSYYEIKSEYQGPPVDVLVHCLLVQTQVLCNLAFALSILKFFLN